LDGDRRKGFEELVCQLAHRQPPANAVAFRRVEGSGGDGGVEAYWIDSHNHEHGFQAKYFLATKEIDWAQVDKSVTAALNLHPMLQSYVVALACDLTDRSGSLGRGKTGWQRWSDHKEKWEKLAKSKGMKVEFSAWTKSIIINDLASHADRRGLTLFWFDSEILDEKRLAELFARARADLGERFHPEDNVRTTLTEAFEGMRRSPRFIKETAAWFRNCPATSSLERSVSLMMKPPPQPLMTALKDAVRRLHEIGVEIENIGMAPFKTDQWRSAISDFQRACEPLSHFFSELPRSDEHEGRHTSNARNALQPFLVHGDIRPAIAAIITVAVFLACTDSRTDVGSPKNGSTTRMEPESNSSAYRVHEAGR
jgi:hypothetical protein